MDYICIAIIFLVIYFITIYGGGWFVGSLVQKIFSEKMDLGAPGAGQLIGYCERFLVITLLLMNAYPAVGGIVALKGIIRFAEIKVSEGQDNKHQRHAEYVLLGSLLSLSWAVLWAGILKLLVSHSCQKYGVCF